MQKDFEFGSSVEWEILESEAFEERKSLLILNLSWMRADIEVRSNRHASDLVSAC